MVLRSDDQHVVIYGATGAIGGALRAAFAESGWRVTATGRRPSAGVVALDPFAATYDPAVLDADGPYDAAIWAQGANASDNVRDVDADNNLALYKANCLFNILTLQSLLQRNLLKPSARLLVISSIWQNLARQNKLSYCVTKAALQGFVLSAAADLASDGHVINAILPGPMDTPMTRKAMAPAQIDFVSRSTGFGRLPALQDVTSTALFLCSSGCRVTGQFIEADLGFSRVRLI